MNYIEASGVRDLDKIDAETYDEILIHHAILSDWQEFHSVIFDFPFCISLYVCRFQSINFQFSWQNIKGVARDFCAVTSSQKDLFRLLDVFRPLSSLTHTLYTHKANR